MHWMRSLNALKRKDCGRNSAANTNAAIEAMATVVQSLEKVNKEFLKTILDGEAEEAEVTLVTDRVVGSPNISISLAEKFFLPLAFLINSMRQINATHL